MQDTILVIRYFAYVSFIGGFDSQNTCLFLLQFETFKGLFLRVKIFQTCFSFSQFMKA